LEVPYPKNRNVRRGTTTLKKGKQKESNELDRWLKKKITKFKKKKRDRRQIVNGNPLGKTKMQANKQKHVQVQ